MRNLEAAFLGNVHEAWFQLYRWNCGTVQFVAEGSKHGIPMPILNLAIDEDQEWQASDREVGLSFLEVFPLFRGLGYASLALKALCETADRLERTLGLCVAPYSVIGHENTPPRDQDALYAFYSRHGFKGERGSRICLQRRPSAPGRPSRSA